MDLRIPTIRLPQGDSFVYLFGTDGRTLSDLTCVSRVNRQDGDLMGYQRPEVGAHVRAIRQYLETPGALLPNAIVLAFDERVRYDERLGHLVIPFDPEAPEHERPAWIVDGQQRTAALRDAELAGEFFVAVVGFHATTEQQRSQFILVNNTKPLPKGLIYELLPDTTGPLPRLYARKQLPAMLVSRLNSDEDSPFRGRITMPTAPDGYIKDNSVLRMVEASITDGTLFDLREDPEAALLVLKTYWEAVRLTWPDAWDLPPRKSRLTHGAGIVSLGSIMDTLAFRLGGIDLRSVRAVLGQLPVAWSSGTWHFPDEVRSWSSLQNTTTDVRLLTRYLERQVGIACRHAL